MNRTVTQNETDELFKVCNNYGVFFYDVQIEVVDHLASLIEEQWKVNPNLNFDQAKTTAILSFGKSNFTKMVRTKEKELTRKYGLLLWNHLLEFYRWPKLLLTIALSLGTFILFQIAGNTKAVLLSYSGFILLGFAIYLFFLFPKIKLKTRTDKTFLLQGQQSIVMSLLVFIIQLPNFINTIFGTLKINTIDNNLTLGCLSVFLVFASILLYASTFYLPKKIKDHFIEQFPEFVK